jgi:hypothetical protein
MGSARGAVSLKAAKAISVVRKAVNNANRDTTWMRVTAPLARRRSLDAMSVALLTSAPSVRVLTYVLMTVSVNAEKACPIKLLIHLLALVTVKKVTT